MKKIVAIRGAACAENTVESITFAVCQMCTKIIKMNNISVDDIISIHFSLTKDLNILNPATALRKGQSEFDFSKCALFCTQEAEIVGMLPKTIRVLLTTYAHENIEIKNIYILGAEKLRPDLLESSK